MNKKDIIRTIRIFKKALKKKVVLKQYVVPVAGTFMKSNIPLMK